MLERTNGGFLISKIKQIQGRVFERMLDENGISEFNGAQGRILFVLWVLCAAAHNSQYEK